MIEEAKFKTFGCGSAIASSSLATEWVKGKTVEEALAIKNTDIVRELALPPVKIHCSVLAEDAIKAAIGDWKKKQGEADSKLTKQIRLLSRRSRLMLRLAHGAVRVLDEIWHGEENDHDSRTEKAASKIRELLTKEGVPAETGGLRVGVQGGGCSGLSYAMRLDTQARDRDKVFEENGARVFVDPRAICTWTIRCSISKLP